MTLLSDMNLSPLWVGFLKTQGVEAVHWSTLGDIRAKDPVIMAWARERGWIVFTHDLDFSALLATTGGTEMTFRSGIFPWFAKDQWAVHICEDLRPVLSHVATAYGVRVAALGLWNGKAPDPVAFLDAPLPISQLRADLALRKLRHGSLGQYAGLAPSVILEDEFLGCNKCRLSVVFERSP